MDNLRTILAVVDTGGQARNVLEKAVRLARHFGSKIELFLCDSEHAYILDRAYDASGVDRARTLCLEEGRRYLEHLRSECRASDVSIDIDVSCESPLYEGIVHKAKECGANLVIKSPTGEHPMRRLSLGANDWQLARACPASLMLVRGRKWNAPPRFAAAVDVSDAETSAVARRVMYTAEYLALGCGAELEMMHCEDPSLHSENASAGTGLEQLAAEHRVPPEKLHVLRGVPEQTLPPYASARAYDVLVMGALTHRTGVTALVGTLTSHLLDALECDFVLVKPAPVDVAHGSPTFAAKQHELSR